jgi:peptidoglycan/LPS O-acetylase OafA/YrhL
VSGQGVFDVLTVLYVAAFVLFAIGAAFWTVDRRRARKNPDRGCTPRWIRLGTIACSLMVALLNICLFVGKWGFLEGLSCILWIVVSALWIAEYRLERKRERKDG